MGVDRDLIVEVFERRGDRRRARLAEQALPARVDPEESAGVLSWLGLDPRRIDLTVLDVSAAAARARASRRSGVPAQEARRTSELHDLV